MAYFSRKKISKKLLETNKVLEETRGGLAEIKRTLNKDNKILIETIELLRGENEDMRKELNFEKDLSAWRKSILKKTISYILELVAVISKAAQSPSMVVVASEDMELAREAKKFATEAEERI